jgi:hypothetical protein
VWICVTNDGALCKACQQEGVRVLWGLEVTLELVRLKQLTAADATAVATAMHQVSPFHITKGIVGQFVRRVREISETL